MLERLQKVLAAAGVASRRDAEAMIRAGRVQVDGRPVTELGTKVDPEQAAIQVDGRPIQLRPPSIYVALNKPAGFVSTRSDPHASHTVMELVLPGLEARFGRGDPSVEGLHPVGRLDRESEGLLLLTNDGAFTHALTHPRHEVTKRYLAEVTGRPTPAELERLRTGVLLEGRLTSPAQARVKPVAAARGGRQIELVLREGRKRQVRLMLAEVGYPVRRLVRTAIGPVELGSLRPGQFRLLSPAEVLALMEAAAAPEKSASTPEPTPVSSGRPPQSKRPVRTRPNPPRTRAAQSRKPDSPSPGQDKSARQRPKTVEDGPRARPARKK